MPYFTLTFESGVSIMTARARASAREEDVEANREGSRSTDPI